MRRSVDAGEADTPVAARCQQELCPCGMLSIRHHASASIWHHILMHKASVCAGRHAPSCRLVMQVQKCESCTILNLLRRTALATHLRAIDGTVTMGQSNQAALGVAMALGLVPDTLVVSSSRETAGAAAVVALMAWGLVAARSTVVRLRIAVAGEMRSAPFSAIVTARQTPGVLHARVNNHHR